MLPVFLIIGPSGCGKGTQAGLLAEKLHIPCFSMGQILRDLFSQSNPLGIKAKSYIDQGQWVPSDLTIASLATQLVDLKTGFVLDGIPRLYDQIAPLEALLSTKNMAITAVIHLDLPDAISLDRMLSRQKIEEASGAIRSDQTPEVMRERLASYHQSIEPIFTYFEQNGLLERVDGAPLIQDIAADIEKRLTQRGISFV